MQDHGFSLTACILPYKDRIVEIECGSEKTRVPAEIRMQGSTSSSREIYRDPPLLHVKYF